MGPTSQEPSLGVAVVAAAKGLALCGWGHCGVVSGFGSGNEVIKAEDCRQSMQHISAQPGSGHRASGKKCNLIKERSVSL